MDQGTLDCFVKKKKGPVLKDKPTPIKKTKKIPTPKKSEESQWCLEHLENSEEKKPLSPEMQFLAQLKSDENTASSTDDLSTAATNAASAATTGINSKPHSPIQEVKVVEEVKQQVPIRSKLIQQIQL